MLQSTAQSDVLEEIRALKPIECGKEAAKQFAFEPGYRNLNHGSYGTYPIAVRNVLRNYQERTEARPDTFIRYDYRTKLLDESREAIASYLHADVNTCVLVPNTSTAIDTIFRNLVYAPGDVIVAFSTAYGAFKHLLLYLAEITPVEVETVDYVHPISDNNLVELFAATLRDINAAARTARVALFDTINSEPGVRMPFERLTEVCRSSNVMSLIDGAHGVGDIDLNLRQLDPDFFVSNCHKWLHVPRGCAVLYVPERNQHLLRATLPVSFGFVPAADGGKGKLPAESAYVSNFSSVGTLDDTPYLCIPAAIEWRKKLSWGDKQGEDAVRAYNRGLARKGGHVVADILGTEVLENKEGTLGECNMTNIRLPLVREALHSPEVRTWVMRATDLEYNIPVYPLQHGGAWWVRLSAQVYLTLEDFEAAGQALKVVCERVNQGEWKGSDSPTLFGARSPAA